MRSRNVCMHGGRVGFCYIITIAKTLYHNRDDALLYIAYVMLIWAAPILLTGGSTVCGHSLHLGLTGTPPNSRDKLCPDSALQVFC